MPAAFSANVDAFSSNGGKDSNRGSSSNEIAESPDNNRSAVRTSARYSASFPGLDEARKSLTGARTEFHGQHRALLVGKPPNARRGQRQQVLHLASGERPAFRGRLNLHKVSAAGHDHVHVHFG